MKKLLSALIVTAVLLMSGCSPLVHEDEHIDLYASFYPLYALLDGLTKNIPDMQLHCLVQPQDGCIRDYELSDWDLYMLAASADAVIIGGRGLESFENTMFSWGDSGPAVSSVLYNLDLLNQQDEVSGEDASHFEGANPHLYMSVIGAGEILDSMHASLVSLDPRYAELYDDNLFNAHEKLNSLSAEIEALSLELTDKPVIIMNEALIYTAHDLGITTDMCYERESGVMLYDAEFSNCLELLSSSDAKVVLIEKQAPAALVKQLEEAGYTVARLDVFSDHFAISGAFEDYLMTMKENAAAVSDAFSKAY